MIALTRNSARRYCWIAAVATIACSTSRSSESQSSYTQKVDTVTERGAQRVVTTVREFAPDAGYTKVIREIVRVTERDPVVTHTDSSVAASGEASSKSTTKVGFQLWPWLLGAGALAAAGFVLWKLKPPWVTAALTVLKSVFRRSN